MESLRRFPLPRLGAGVRCIWTDSQLLNTPLPDNTFSGSYLCFGDSECSLILVFFFDFGIPLYQITPSILVVFCSRVLYSIYHLPSSFHCAGWKPPPTI
ncbi:hypothetical protein QL285_022021 [Trifolium repens]|nr:hypothetical protein QL285_022021 [Trifolium repens]